MLTSVPYYMMSVCHHPREDPVPHTMCMVYVTKPCPYGYTQTCHTALLMSARS